MLLAQERLRIEQVDLRRRAGLEQVDDPLRLAGSVQHLAVLHRAERGGAEAGRRRTEEGPAREGVGVDHRFITTASDPRIA